MMLIGLLIALAGQTLAAQRERQARDPVAQARVLYNDGQYDQAIAAAKDAQASPSLGNAASLVLGRAHIERFRRTGDAADLIAAREALRSVKTAGLASRDRVELVIGLGEVLYLENSFGAAAQMFETILERAPEVGPGARDRVLDWWATALDREAQERGPAERAAIYGAILSQMRDELRTDPASAVAGYWLAAAWRGLGDLESAWTAAVAAWVRAPIAGERGASLRTDLDRLVSYAIIPERARRQGPGRNVDESVAALTAEWEQIKERWTGK